ncbi:MAG: hypothetical protein IKM94_05035 [Alphaproteobacteria bacterium]|nr:hypothetical protein [Alphaproteobacteria bacterium]
MKGLNLILAACLTVQMMDCAVADTSKIGTRTNTNRTQTITTQNRTQSAPKRQTATQTRTANQKNIIQRTTSAIKNITEQNRGTNATRDIVSRTAKKQNILGRTATTPTTAARTATPQPRTISRVAETPTKTRESIMQRDFGKCKSVFFDCMDEFCANKDTQLKRCACSTRANEFRTTQKSLDNVEDKLLDFSQRLLQVNMDPADAAVINIETEGERAYNETIDKTTSKKTLDEIAKKLNSTFDSATANNMSALTWSLNADSAFDSVDSLSGTATTAKSGTALRNAALPICRDMAAEVCDETDISLVENSYNMAIEQDCNTVKRAYETQTQAAKNKILESAALLDMTRLNNYQDKNADDILTCKSKMLDTLTDTNVCGENLTKCLDISGRYINPTTGEAFLSPDLVNLADLLVRPTNGDTWSKTPKNSTFVSYLNTKKKYIEPATKNCQEIADTVWNSFIDDALSQIKIAQNAKLEEVRQSCTKLLTDCLDNAKTDLANFDSRALSTFGVQTDKTANALCENVKTSCAAIMDYTPDGGVFATTAAVIITGTDENNNDITIKDRNNWTDGVTDIAARETYNTIINTCREVGRDCIINSCKSITGNFGLCESINGSVNRHSILTRAACWAEVYNCVAAASDETINNIHSILPIQNNTPQNLYEQIYSDAIDKYIATTTATNPNREVYDICRINGFCASVSASDNNDRPDTNCYRCRIAEQIWGHCKYEPNNRQENPILIPNKDSNTTTLLSWFAKNTHTQDVENSCATSICPAGELDMLVNNQTVCKKPSVVLQCPSGDTFLCESRINTVQNNYNCCPTNMLDSAKNCCMDGMISQYQNLLSGYTESVTYCTTSGTSNMTQVAQYTSGQITTHIFCTGGVTGTVGNDAEIDCNGEYIIAECQGFNGNNNTHTVCKYQKPSLNGNDINYDYSMNYFINANVGSANNNLIEDANTINSYCPGTGQNSTPYKCEFNGTNWTDGCGTPSKWLVDF